MAKLAAAIFVCLFAGAAGYAKMLHKLLISEVNTVGKLSSSGTARRSSAVVTDGECAGDLSQTWVRHYIDRVNPAENKNGADGVRLADANGDGLMDVATPWEEGGAIRVCFNPGPAGARNATAWPCSTAGIVNMPEDAVLADLNGDGRMDMVSASDAIIPNLRSVYIHWAPPLGFEYTDEAKWTTMAIPATVGLQAWMFTLPFDMDGAHGLDVVVGGKYGSAAIGWLESPADPSDASAWRYHHLQNATWIMSIEAFDMDMDGDLDILYNDRQDGVIWLENGADWSPHLLTSDGDAQRFLAYEDGALAVAVADKNYVRVQGKAGWPEILAMPHMAGTPKGLHWANIAKDDALVVTCENADNDRSGVWWYTPAGGWHDISGPEGVKYDLVEVLDIDGDGDLDVITCEETDDLGVVWYENPC